MFVAWTTVATRAEAERLAHHLRDIGSIAQAHVEALGADRRNDVGGFADQRDAIFGDLHGPLDRERESVAAGLDRGAPEDGV